MTQPRDLSHGPDFAFKGSHLSPRLTRVRVGLGLGSGLGFGLGFAFGLGLGLGSGKVGSLRVV